MLILYIAIKFRLFGHDLATIAEEADIHPLEGTVTVVNNPPSPPANPLYTFSRFGVTVSAAFDPTQLAAVEPTPAPPVA